jgi:heme O synthase-like polyprenyltransferase
MLKTIFRIVAGALWLMGRVTGRTYNEMNIIVYYFMIPYSWLLMLDAILGFHYCAIVGGVFYLLLWLAIKNFRSFSDDVFDFSERFLNSFNSYGSNYVASSVWLCVALPLAIYGVLFYYLFK